MSSQRYWTTREYAQKVGASPSTISKWLRSGKLKGEKQNGKWVIPCDPSEVTAKPSSSKSESTLPEAADTAGDQYFSVEEFSRMSYLTEVGVIKWLKEGRLKGMKDSSGQWRVSANNLSDPNVKRLLRD